MLPTRKQIDAERALKKQIAKEGLEIDQGVFIAHVLADERCGMHLVHAMLRPKREAEELLPEFRRTGRVAIGDTTVERKGNVGTVTHGNRAFLNAEDDGAMAAMETAVDLVLLDDRIQVGVLRGGLLQHPKYQGKRIFNAGINLTHLYYGQISFIEFIMERELGLLNKIYRGHSNPDRRSDQLEDVVEKPWLAVVDSFAIGGGCQLLGVMDRVIAEPGAYFNLPASKEGFIPGSANLRLPRLTGIQQARHGIFFEKKFYAGTPEGHAHLRRSRGSGRHGCGDRTQYQADDCRRLHQHGQQPQGLACRSGALGRLSALHGGIQPSASLLLLRPGADLQSRAQLAAAEAPDVVATMPSEPAAQQADAGGIGTSLSANFTVHDKDTVGHLVPGMPMVAATPYLVTIAEMVCYEICKKLIEPGQVTVGTRVEIDHLGASKVGATLVVNAVLRARERNRFTFDVTVTDGERTVAKIVHGRAAVSTQKMMAALG